jgi:hypothetical protein
VGSLQLKNVGSLQLEGMWETYSLGNCMWENTAWKPVCCMGGLNVGRLQLEGMWETYSLGNCMWEAYSLKECGKLTA